MAAKTAVEMGVTRAVMRATLQVELKAADLVVLLVAM